MSGDAARRNATQAGPSHRPGFPTHTMQRHRRSGNPRPSPSAQPASSSTPIATARKRAPFPRLSQLNELAQRHAGEPHRVLYTRPYRTGWPGIAGAWLITRQAPLDARRPAHRRAILGSRQRTTRILQKAWGEVQRAALRRGRMPPCTSLDELRGLIAAAPFVDLRVGQLTCTRTLHRFVNELKARA